MLFSPRSPFARLSEAGGAQIFGRSFRTQQQSPVSLHQRAPLNEIANPKQETHRYERRPRRKTKEDRYEYKGHDRRADPERSKKKKKKTAKQSRKHTLNRDFHAPNVSQTRLTLASHPNMGIFGKGRTSSPIKSRELPDLTFSEMNFLSRRSRLNPNELLVEEQQDETNGAARRQHDSQTQIPQYFSNDYPDEPPVIDETAYPSAQDPDQPEPAAVATEAHGSRAMRPADLSPKLSRSATPYTCSESDCREHERRASSKNCTKGILCVDLNHQHISDEEKANRRYWDLDELKLILMILQQVRNGSRANKEPEACDHSKRRRQPDEVDDEPRSPKKSKLSNAIASIRKPLSSPASSSTERDTPLHGHPKPGTYTPERQTSRDIDHHELELTPKQVCFSDYCSMSQNCNRAIAPHQNPRPNRNIDGAGPDEIDLDAEFNSIVRIFSRETAYGKDEDVIMKNFDAVYDSIVLEDKDPAHGDLSRVPSNQSYFVSIPDCSTPLPESIDEGWNLSLPSGITNHSSSNNFLAAHTHYQPHNINEGVQTSNNPIYDAWNGFSQPIMSVGMGAAALGTPTGFCWRQNKLY
ncbi:hypothetical protein SI65_09868 [Aspergillus cristatus]|uniref:Uncharacterized protein n=1 Tax=Aspergillus cristatus TaxID=573508 RepID=A0A1E3B184_ASPCR|nr:hypothetical protein SI65_09868 [Aspergillus cristatus]